MMGEHGFTAFPVFSRLNVQGFREKELDSVFKGKEPLDRETFRQKVVKTAFDVLNGKGWTNAGVAEAAVTLAKAVMLDEKSIYPVSATLHGQYGYNGDVALSIPSVIYWGGIEQQLEIELDEQETSWLHESAKSIQHTMASVKTGKSYIRA